MQNKLTDDQFHLLSFLVNTYTASGRRTDALALHMTQCAMPRTAGGKWDNSHVPFIGLQLRDAGYVSTYKDNQQYARWDVTASGKALFLEERNIRTRQAEQKLAEQQAQIQANRGKNSVSKDAPITVPTGKGYVVISTTDSGEQSKILKLKTEADKLAEEWAKEEPGSEYLVCQVLSKVKSSVVVTKE